MFTEDYYLKIIAQYGYNPLRFNNINFTFPGIDEIEMRNMWLCSYNIDSNFNLIARSYSQQELDYLGHLI